MHLSTTSIVISVILSVASAANITHNGLGTTPAQRHIVSASQALKVISAARDSALNISVAESIAVLNPYGIIVAILSMDNAPISTIDVAMKKAKTTALTNGIPSGDWLQVAQGPEIGLEETNGGLVVFPGGLPLYLDGILLGAVGCSGAPSAQDDVAICAAGAAALG